MLFTDTMRLDLNDMPAVKSRSILLLVKGTGQEMLLRSWSKRDHSNVNGISEEHRNHPFLFTFDVVPSKEYRLQHLKLSSVFSTNSLSSNIPNFPGTRPKIHLNLFAP